MHRIIENANLHSRPRRMRQLYGTGETLVALSGVLLQANLQFHRIQTLVRVFLRPFENGNDTLLERVGVELGHGCRSD